jgi:hypothetical protein
MRRISLAAERIEARRRTVAELAAAGAPPGAGLSAAADAPEAEAPS